jgi:hypothetical protein
MLQRSSSVSGRTTAAFFIAWLIVAHAVLAAQANYARLGGTVTDPSGGVLPGASVILRNVRTNVTQEASTDTRGRFTFSEVSEARTH